MTLLDIVGELVDLFCSWRVYVCLLPALLAAFFLHQSFPRRAVALVYLRAAGPQRVRGWLAMGLGVEPLKAPLHAAMTSHSALDNLARLVQVIARDAELRSWFEALTQKSMVERRNEVFTMTERMRAEGKDPDLVSTFRLLGDARVFKAACLALQEHDKQD